MYYSSRNLYRVSGLILLAACSVVVVSFSSCSQHIAADLILTNGQVATMDNGYPQAEALAVLGDTILAIGTSDEIDAYRSGRTRIIDLNGAFVMPGFIESHAHFLSLGRSLRNLNLRQAESFDEIVAMVAGAVKSAEPGDWIVGRGWHQEKWTQTPQPNVDGLPYHDALSEVTPHNPVMLTHASGHAVMVNAKAMEIAGITSETPDPKGGEIVRAADGRPIGILRETAEDLVDSVYDAFSANRTPEENQRDVNELAHLAGQECLANGITTLHDAGESFETIDILKQAAEDGELDVRLWVMVSGDEDSLENRLPGYRIIDAADHFFTVRAIKTYVDGALGSHGAWLLEPYTDMPASSGLNVTPLDELRRVAELAVENDFQLCAHAIGDRGNREMLNMYEEVLDANGANGDSRWRIEHAQHIDPADIPRFAELGVIAAMQGVHCTSDGPWVPKRIGDRRAREGAYVWQDLLQSGAVICNGTDAPVEDISPIECFYASVTRRLPDGSQFYPEQVMGREEALRSYTIDAAYAGFEEDIKGSLSPGKLADITVLSHNILTCSENEILDTDVLYTIVGGQVRYEALR